MQIISTTPFGQRPVSADLLDTNAVAYAAAEVAHFDKWELFRELCVARFHFGITDRDLTVLNALLSFHQGRALSDNDNLVVFPSNRALSTRAHGMAESTLRRHLAALVKSGLITRHDSPNGKRYAAKDRFGDIIRAFGFNLRPLLVRATEITDAAETARSSADRLRRVREECSVTLRDATKLAEYGVTAHPSSRWTGILSTCEGITRILRRKLPIEGLKTLLSEISDLLKDVQSLLGSEGVKTHKMSAKDIQNERHYQNSNKDSHDLEPSLEKEKGQMPDPEITNLSDRRQDAIEKGRGDEPNLPLGLVVKACPDIVDYAKDGIDNWYDLVSVAHFVRGMMGISPDAWRRAQEAMGSETASIVLAAMLQRVADINSPGGYLRSLTTKAQEGTFSPGPMIMALLNGAGGKVA